ncbi:NnrU family protein [Aquisediminimonas sediminicola]|uniref:NnrU family protein n=1 Tax=Alteraquisediminimonas sediminicola TaxID=2676787 RepID=UPI001C8D757C|nr:NnrU family protein [Aquisediminimonas sediminicola]
METLFAGVIIWTMAHLIASVAPGLRAELDARMGLASRGLIALFILTGLGLMVVGWQSAVPHSVYDPPFWGRHLNMALMFISVMLVFAGRDHSRIRRYLRHPMLTGAVIWAVGHLLANGDSRSVVLFAGIGLWACVSIGTISKREGAWVKPVKVAGIGREILGVTVALIVYVALVWGHGYLTGVPLLPNG